MRYIELNDDFYSDCHINKWLVLAGSVFGRIRINSDPAKNQLLYKNPLIIETINKLNRNYFEYKIHFVWSTKYRQPLLSKKLRILLYYEIKRICKQKGYHLDYVGGYLDHIHILVGLEPVHIPYKFVKDIKGITSRWINENKYTDSYFSWQRGYGMFSVSKSNYERIIKYIQNQEIHHQRHEEENIENMY